MTDPDPFEHLLDQIADLLALAQENKSKTIKAKLDKDIHRQLDEIEKGVELFRKITDDALKKSGISEETVKKNISEPSDVLSRKEKRLLERTKKLKSELQVVESEYAIKCNIAKLQKKKLKTAGKKRKRKFRRLGGQGWIPL